MRLNQLAAELEELSYPRTTAELAAAFDGRTLYHAGGGEPVSAVLERAGSDAVTSADDAWLSVAASLDENAVGRKGYSDRDPPVDRREFDAVSF